MQQTIERPTSQRRLGPDTGGARGQGGGNSPRTTTTGSAPARTLPCRVQDPDLWFAEAPAQLEIAKELCSTCPVRAACLAGALDRAEPWGVWGGEIFQQGVVIARKRPRGRPRKDAAA
ncbi:WhiB family transcriptional regulator [Modestobacter sp. I12A-02628]|uniref:Transcriptional regulator WhiB n=1 Tax=Goekera deserti TaxID=2497753 RepID=A0A7K3W7R7_9ACTN|nr:WhiB family transcriptional regulator [Goekera deserti]MPQ99857.1 WhiB family transcriptional regulator [Goekera deserti]NDI50015.1 WhiB family transcriptional regulator [Goekera deserti]NEL52508.1 WhiB family transcriptional regulator [Goekera deserti]